MKTEIINNIVLCFPGGRIGNDSAADFECNITRIINEHETCDLILNMKHVSSIGSKCIAVLILFAQEMKGQDRLFSICNPSDLVKKIISIFNAGSFITVCQTEEDAINAMLQVSVVSRSAVVT